MDRWAKAALNRGKADRLNKTWAVGAVQARYSDDGHWYAALSRFPAALFDANGYILFETEREYRSSPHLSIGKQISVPRPGISAIPGYVFVTAADGTPSRDVDIHTTVASEGRRRLVQHLQRERNQTLVRKKKAQAVSLDCEICGFSFDRAYGAAASEYCEVHHLLPLSMIEQSTRTRMEDLAILCANCHRVVHLREDPEPYTLEEVKKMLSHSSRKRRTNP
jgi:5-methylcytosine-specific restriction endonuclease McrA